MGGKKGKTTENTNQKLSLAIKSGKHKVGFKAVMKCLRNGQSKLVIISNNCPAIRKTQLEYMAILGGSKVLTSTETTSSSALLSRECTVFACSPSRTLAIRTSSPLWSTEQLSLSDLSIMAGSSDRDWSRWRARMRTHHITDIVRLFARLLLIHIKI